MPSTYTNLHYHFVFGTKNREPLIASAIQEKLYRYIGGVLTQPEHHRSSSFQDEIHRLLEQHHIDFSKEKLFDE